MGLDPGSYDYGWALLEGDKARSGSHALRRRGGDIAAPEACERAREWLDDLIAKEKPTKVFIAMPYVRDRDTKNNLIPLFGMVMVTKVACFRQNVPCRELQEMDARKWLIGGVPRGKDAKDRHVAAVRALGWPCTDHNAADALIVAAYGRSKDEPERAFKDTPLFANKPWLKARICA